MEELKSMPFGAVWDQYCLQSGVPVGSDWLSDVSTYEYETLAKRASLVEAV